MSTEEGPRRERADAIVIGAGLAGTAIAAELAHRGLAPWLIEQGGAPGAGASGNPAAIVKPAVARAASPITDLLDACWRHLQARLAEPELREVAGFRNCGVLQLVEERWRDDRVPHGERWSIVDAATASRLAGVTLPAPAIHFAEGGWLDTGALCRHLAATEGVRMRCGTRVNRLERIDDGRWRVNCRSSHPESTHPRLHPNANGDPDRTGSGDMVIESRHVVIATAGEPIPGASVDALPLVPVRGQTTRWRVPHGTAAPRMVVSGRHYALRQGEHWHSGATYHRHDSDRGLHDEDHEANRAALAALFTAADRVAPASWTVVDGFAGVRATTPDRLPVAGPMPDFEACRMRYAELHHGRVTLDWNAVPVQDGLWILSGLGSRGLLFAPLLARRLVSRIDAVGEAANRGPDFLPLLHPVRFLLRSLRRPGSRNAV